MGCLIAEVHFGDPFHEFYPVVVQRYFMLGSIIDVAGTTEGIAVDWIRGIKSHTERTRETGRLPLLDILHRPGLAVFVRRQPGDAHSLGARVHDQIKPDAEFLVESIGLRIECRATVGFPPGGQQVKSAVLDLGCAFPPQRFTGGRHVPAGQRMIVK